MRDYLTVIFVFATICSMLPLLSPCQFKTISEFCNDIAKGVMLAAIIGQGALSGFSGATRILLSSFWVFMSLFMLYFAVLFSREVKS